MVRTCLCLDLRRGYSSPLLRWRLFVVYFVAAGARNFWSATGDLEDEVVG